MRLFCRALSLTRKAWSGCRDACDTLSLMRVGCFTPLLSQFPLDKVFEKLKGLNINTVELGTGNYPGDPHCKLSMLGNEKELKDFKKKLDDRGFTISALSCHGNPLHPGSGRRERTMPTPAGGQWNLPRNSAFRS